MSRRRKTKAKVTSFDAESMVRDVAKMQMQTAHIPELVAKELKKSWKQLPNVDPKRGAKSWFQDPLSLQYSLGYKERRFSLTYDALKRVAGSLALIGAIINTRAAQVSAFAQPYRWTKSLGFAIKHKDSDHATTPAEVEFIKELESFILNCGRLEKNPHSRVERDNFETLLRKLVRDSLTYDQACIEVVPDRLGLPFEFFAVDGSTMRLASNDRFLGVNSSYHDRSGFVPGMPARFQGLFDGQVYGSEMPQEQVKYVQVINGQIHNVYSNDEMAFGVRNPRSDVYIQGYGYSEVESIITIVTSHLYAEQYNQNFFKQGSSPKGLLNFKGDNFTQEQLEGFRRQWLAQISGVESSWRTPITQAEGIEWISLGQSNSDMEFQKWLDYLTKITCAVFLISSEEVGFEFGSSNNGTTPMFESSNEWKLKASKDKGLKPLLRFFAHLVNKNIIDKIDDHFTLEFVGLDELSENEKHEMMVEQLSSYMTLNEVRRTKDLPDLDGGDIPMNPVYVQALQAQQSSEEGGGQPPGVEDGGDDGAPNYSSQFGMDDNI